MQRAEPPSPRRLHVLLVGTDQETERRIRIQLIHSYYQITPHRTFNSALEFFEKEKFNVDLVLSDVSLKVEESSNSFEGYDFIEQIQLLKQNIPHVVIFGAERLVPHDITRAYKLGAYYVLKKPISEGSDEIGNLWQHIFRWRAQNEDLWQQVFRWRAQNDGSSSLVSSQQETLKRGYEFINHGQEPSLRKQRMVWTEELDSLFVQVVNYLVQKGKDVVPKKIHEEMTMGRPELSLTREQVGSHLQKHREKEKKKQLPQPRPRFDFHLPETSTINSLPLPQMQHPHYNEPRIFCPPQIEPEHHEQHLACPPMNKSLIENGSSNLIPQHQPDFQVNTTRPAMHKPDRITSSKSNMLQQRQPQGPSSKGMESDMLQQQHFANGTSFGRCNMQQLRQNRALGTSFINSNMLQQQQPQGLSSEGMESDMLQQQHFANGTSFGRSNMQQLHQNRALGTSFENSHMEQQLMTQNLTSSTQQLDHTSSAVCAPIRSGHDGMITPEATHVDEFADLPNQQLEVDVQQSYGARDIFPNQGSFLDAYPGIEDPFQSIKHPFQEINEMAEAITASRSINDSLL